MKILWYERGKFGLLGETNILVCYRNIPYWRIELNRVETMNMGRFHWNNGVSRKCNPCKHCGN